MLLTPHYTAKTSQAFWLIACSMFALTSQSAFASDQDRLPNIVYILADDLGYNEVGSYGQEKIQTPNLDQLAADGMKFTQHYSGSPVCASSRCVLLTGKHTGHAYVRGNKEMGGWGPDEPEGQLPLLAAEITIAELLKSKGYATGAFGKWGLGGPGSEGHPCHQGFDRFYGYLCQRVAHNYYPTHLWDNHDVDVLGNDYFAAHQKLQQPLETEAEYFERYESKVYAPDRMIEEALSFIDENKENPFFLYYATPVPHVAIQVPQDSLDEYRDRFEDEPYLGDKAYLPHPQPRAGYAAMITRMDRDIGQMMERIEKLGLSDQTLIMFSSDNGPTFNGGTDSEYFESNRPLRGLKTMVFDGGIRVPMIARFPNVIEAGTVTHHISGFQDVLPTLCDLVGVDVPEGLDGISMLPTLTGRDEEQRAHDHLYWELGRNQALRAGDWKLVRLTNRNDETETLLFNLKDDVGEQTNLAETHPDDLERMLKLVREARSPSQQFPSVYDDGR